MKNALLFLIVSLPFIVSCKKQAIGEPSSDASRVVTTVSNASAVLDPVNYPPAVSKILPNAIQLNYGAVRIGKTMNLLLANITPSIMSQYSFHIYLKANNKYYHLPGVAGSAVSYSYSLKAVFPYCNVTISRPPGTPELFDDVIIVSAKIDYLSTFVPSIDFADYNTAKTKLGF
ncbi:MAG: hypothetical protein ABIX01_19935 [Chitinophagaceae bacterium]